MEQRSANQIINKEDNDVYLYKTLLTQKISQSADNMYNIEQYAEIMAKVEDYVMTNIHEFVDIRVHSSAFKSVALKELKQQKAR